MSGGQGNLSEATASQSLVVAVESLSQEITEGCLVLLGEYDTDLLRAGLEEARLVSPDGWMTKMLAEYLEFWR